MLQVGQIIGKRYKIINILGQGGTSVVYLVMDVHIKKRWALKEITRHNHLACVLANREVDILKSIDYPLFPRIIDAWQDVNALYIVCDYVEGISMNKIILNKGIGIEQAVKWALQIANAISYLHGLSPPILYLDLKPDNILVKPNGDVMLVDFGIALRLADKSIPMGTVGYAAPEQYKGHNSEVDARTDIYALGMTYYAMRLGEPPDIDYTVTTNRIRTSNILSHTEKTILTKCIATNKSERYGSADEVAYQLKHINLYPFNNRKLYSILAILIFIILIGVVCYGQNNKLVKRQEAALRMVSEANKYLEDGEYTLEGLKVITTFINGGVLDENTSQEFCYEVANNYFEVQRDYREAYRYYAKLDNEKYPEADELMQLCMLQLEFDYDTNKVMNCLGKFYGKVARMPMTKRKAENILFISRCYENYDENRKEGIKKALTVLETDRLEVLAMDENDNSDLKNRYQERIDYLYDKAKSNI